ncbi:MAG: hypothetical protein Q4E12_06555 [Coriobacteriia bacterium]|nr:hypothetical protein [Coriobacteriia bacterium]
MTVLEFWHLIRPKLALVIAVPLVCAVVAFVAAMLLIPNTYQAKASLVVTENVQTVKGVADNAAAATHYDGIALTTSVNTASATVTITATGQDSAACVEAANAALNQANTEACSMLDTLQTNLQQATAAADVTHNRLFYPLATFLIVFFALLCAILVRHLWQQSQQAQQSLQSQQADPPGPQPAPRTAAAPGRTASRSALR